jgi:hypothetical protein
VRTNHHAEVVTFEEGVDVIGTEVYDVVLLLWVTSKVVLESILFFSLMRIAPKQVKHLLVVLALVSTKLDLEWSLDLFDSLEILDSWADSTMAAEDTLLLIRYDSSQGHLLKGFINLHEYTIWVIDVFSKTLGALVSEAEILVHVFVFVVASKEHNLLGVL